VTADISREFRPFLFIYHFQRNASSVCKSTFFKTFKVYQANHACVVEKNCFVYKHLTLLKALVINAIYNKVLSTIVQL